jgi:hypothetical protein
LNKLGHVSMNKLEARMASNIGLQFQLPTLEEHFHRVARRKGVGTLPRVPMEVGLELDPLKKNGRSRGLFGWYI